MQKIQRILVQSFPIIILIYFVLLSSSCREEEPTFLTSRSIETFKVEGHETHLNGSSKTIVIRVPAEMDVSQLVPIIVVSKGATVSPASGVAQDFSKPVVYTVTSESNVSQEYTVSVEYYYGLKEFSIKTNDNFVRTGIIDHNKREIIVKASFWNLRSFVMAGIPVITQSSVSDGYSIFPPPGLVVDVDPDPFNIDVANPQDHFVTGPGDLSVKYKVIIQNTANDLLGFRLNIPGVDIGLLGTQLETTIRPLVLTTDDLSALTVNVRMSERATLRPAADVPMNFNKDVVYSVISEAGTKRDFTVKVDKRLVIFTNEHSPNIEKNIFVLNHQGTINYRAISNIVGARLLHPETSDAVACTVENEVFEGKMRLRIIPASPYEGKYLLEVTLETGEVILTVYHMEY